MRAISRDTRAYHHHEELHRVAAVEVGLVEGDATAGSLQVRVRQCRRAHAGRHVVAADLRQFQAHGPDCPLGVTQGAILGAAQFATAVQFHVVLVPGALVVMINHWAGMGDICSR